MIQHRHNLIGVFWECEIFGAMKMYWLLVKELMGEEDDTEEDDEETPQDRDDFSTEKIPCVSPLRQSTSAYSQFINRIVNDAVVVLWPENTAMVLARFLANYHQYSALQVPIFSFFFFF